MPSVSLPLINPNGISDERAGPVVNRFGMRYRDWSAEPRLQTVNGDLFGRSLSTEHARLYFDGEDRVTVITRSAGNRIARRGLGIWPVVEYGRRRQEYEGKDY